MSNQDWQVVILTIAGVCATLFVIVYPIIAAPWYRSQFGRSLMISELSLAVLLDLSLLAYWFHFEVAKPVATAIFTLIALGCVLRLWAVIYEQWFNRHDS